MPFPDDFSLRAAADRDRAEAAAERAHFDPPELAQARELVAHLSVLIDVIERECHAQHDPLQDAQGHLTNVLDSIEAGVRAERRYREDQR